MEGKQCESETRQFERESSALLQHRAPVRVKISTRERKKKHKAKRTECISIEHSPDSKWEVYGGRHRGAVHGEAAVKCCPALRNSTCGLSCVLRNTISFP